MSVEGPGETHSITPSAESKKESQPAGPVVSDTLAKGSTLTVKPPNVSVLPDKLVTVYV
jgi:hypothetical protein